MASLAALVAVALAAPRLLHGPQVPVEPVQRRDFVQSVVASGRVQTPHRVSIGSTITATVVRVHANEGDRVQAGASLVELLADEPRAALVQAERAERQARARLRQIDEVQRPVAEAAVQSAQANGQATAAALARAEALRAQGFVGEAAVDEARRAHQVSLAQGSSAQRQQAGLGPGGADLQLAQAAAEQAAAGVDVARSRLAAMTLRSPAPATVLARLVEPGDVVQPGRLLMVLSPQGRLELVVQIDEKNLRLLRPGQDARAQADAYPGQVFEARVDRLLPAVDAQRGAVELRLAVDAPPSELRQDMTVSVDIEVARRPLALLAPASAVRDADRAQPWALVLRDGRLARQPLRLGLRSDGWFEVLDGLREGEGLVSVAVQAAQGLEPGQRARPLAAAPQRRAP